MHNFKDLLVWQKSRLLVKEIYQCSVAFPVDEKYGITNQLRRASVSISCNIAEGSGRSTSKDFANFLNIAQASSYEVETLLFLSVDLNFVNEEQIKTILELLQEIQKMIFGLKNKLLNNIQAAQV